MIQDAPGHHVIYMRFFFWASTSLRNFSAQITNSLQVSFSFLHSYDAGALGGSSLSFESLHTEGVYVSLPRRPWRNLLQSAAEAFDKTSRCMTDYSLIETHLILLIRISMILIGNLNQGFLRRKIAGHPRPQRPKTTKAK